jgi:hypothetical protein
MQPFQNENTVFQNEMVLNKAISSLLLIDLLKHVPLLHFSRIKILAYSPALPLPFQVCKHKIMKRQFLSIRLHILIPVIYVLVLVLGVLIRSLT